MFIAINRFKILKGKEQVFEKIWRTRDTHLSNVKGFKQFNLIKSVDQNADQEFTVFASHSIWVSKEDFTHWTRSESFKKAHQGAGKHKDIYIGPPKFEGFEVVI